MRGGYTLIDFKNVSLTTSDTATISGIYEAIEGNYYKRCVATNLTIGGVDKADVEITVFVDESSNFVFELYGYSVSIDDDDVVTLTAKVVPEVEHIEFVADTTDVEDVVDAINDLIDTLATTGIITVASDDAE